VCAKTTNEYFQYLFEPWRCGSGAGVTPVAGNCPLLFEISESGSGLGTVIIDGIERVLTSNPFDVSAKLVDDPTDGVDVVSAFVDSVEADDSVPHPCTQGLTTIDTNGSAADNGDIAYRGSIRK
jgi:hypothetical protein